MASSVDVDQLLASGGEAIKKNLLQRFMSAFTTGVLYKKTGRRYTELLGNGDTLINNGYFISKATLENLNNAITSPAGGVWVNFAVGIHMDRLNELQLVITATETDEAVGADNLGTYCVTTAQIGQVVDPPYTGVVSPKH